MISIQTRRSFHGLPFGASTVQAIDLLGQPRSTRKFDDGGETLSYEKFDLFFDPECGLEHVQITGPIDAVVDDGLKFEWTLDFVRALARLDGDARLGENGYVVKMKRIGVHTLGFHLGDRSDECIGFDGENSITGMRYPETDPPWEG